MYLVVYYDNNNYYINYHLLVIYIFHISNLTSAPSSDFFLSPPIKRIFQSLLIYYYRFFSLFLYPFSCSDAVVSMMPIKANAIEIMSLSHSVAWMLNFVKILSHLIENFKKYRTQVPLLLYGGLYI